MLSQVPAFMDPACADDFASTPEFWPLVINTCWLVTLDGQVFKHVHMGVVENKVPPAI